MELDKSFLILGLTEESSLQELTSVFRKLVKKYHPDLNQDKPEWSNRQMIHLNEAYDSVYEYLSLPDKTDSKSVKEKVHIQRRNLSFAKGVHNALQHLNDGIGIYYQYGLENIALRQEGTRRSRFRSSVRRIKKSFTILQPVAELHLSKNELIQLEIIVNFIRSLYKSIHIQSLRPENESRYERKAFQHYFYGAKLVDKIIKEIMFKEIVERFKQGFLSEKIKLAEAEFNAVIIDYPEAACLPESKIKKELLFSFLDIIELNDRGKINFFCY